MRAIATSEMKVNIAELLRLGTGGSSREAPAAGGVVREGIAWELDREVESSELPTRNHRR
jgi:hypothetical protein